MSNNLIIRPQTIDNPNDYKALAGLYRYAYPEQSSTASGIKWSDNARAPELIQERWFAEQNNVITGVGGFEHWEAFHHPDKYLLHLIVSPEHQGQGVGTALYNHVIEQLEKRRPHFVRTWVQQAQEKSNAFAKKHGFSKIKLKWNVRLKLENWSIDQFAEQVETIRNDGIVVKSLSEMNSDFDHQRKLYELYVMTNENIEGVEPTAAPSFDEFLNEIGQSSSELFFVAIHNDLYVGMWQLEHESVSTLYGGIMAVEKSYRRRGAALALAIHGIARAKSFYYKSLTVHTDEHNRAILGLTEKMGFTHLPAQILFSKQYAL